MNKNNLINLSLTDKLNNNIYLFKIEYTYLIINLTQINLIP
jgi:hypothetical protein